MLEFVLQKRLHTANGEMQLKISCSFENGRFISLYGPSGAGKTSVLRMLAGFMKPDEGYIKLNEEVWFDSVNGIQVKPQHRKIGFVFQDYALFPNMNVRENITFALQKKGPSVIVDELLDLTGLTMLASRNIQTLSGGQQQRVALARAIATRPSLLLLDEPLSAIDHNMRTQLQKTLSEVHKRYHLTSVLVSHNMEEIIRLSDSLIHLEQGMVMYNADPAGFFLSGSKSQALTGDIVKLEEDITGHLATVLLNSRLLRINTTDNTDCLRVGDKVEIIYQNDIALIRKL
jgi:molybdate transport system ATP-binding protein